MNIVYFLGAGASKNFGYPLTGDIMPEILNSLQDNDLFMHSPLSRPKGEDGQKMLLNYFYTLYPGLRNVDAIADKARIPNVTEVLSMIDHCCFYDIPPHPDLSDGSLENFRLLLNRSIGELLLKYELVPYTADEKTLLDRFIQPIKSQKLVDEVTFITTNYDLVIDHEFINETLQNRVDYGISYRNIVNSKLMAAPENPILRYYKLHGSLNWLRCSLCGHYYINPFGSIVHQAFKELSDDDNTCICSKHLRLKTVLVSPSLVRDIRDSNLLQIWKAALEAIRTADKLVFIGYSLPAEDLAIKSVIMRGLNGRNKDHPLEIGVVQYGNAAKNNYLNLFETNITYYANGLEEYLQTNSTI